MSLESSLTSSSSCSANATKGNTFLSPSLANEAAPGEEAQSPSEDDEKSDAKEVAETSGGTQVDAFVFGIGKSHRRSDVVRRAKQRGDSKGCDWSPPSDVWGDEEVDKATKLERECNCGMPPKLIV